MFRIPSRAVLLVFSLLSDNAQALDPSLTIGQLHHDAWTSKDGTPGDCPDPPMIDRTLDEARSAPCRDVAQEACFIARAALQNAFRHAHAAQVTLEAAFGDETFGLRERAAAIGGHLDIVPAQAGQP